MRLTLKAVISVLLPVLCIAEPQVTNYAPFSGAIYIVNSHGRAFTGGGQNWCPAGASVACSNINQPSWCCPNSYTCVSPSNSGGLIGCCPSGSSCSGLINVASITTVTVQAQQPTDLVNAQPPPVTVPVGIPTTTVYPGQYCSTLTMEGPGLPTTRQGRCGTYLIVEEDASSNATVIEYGARIVIFLLQIALGRMFQMI